MNVHRFPSLSADGRRTPRRGTRLLAAGAIVAGVGVLTACGGVDAARAGAAASENLASAKAASFTIHLSDPQGSLAASATTAEDKEAARYLSASALTLTIDPAGDGTLGQTPTTPSGALPPAEALKSSGAMDLALTHEGKQVAGYRMIAGVLYVRADVNELSHLGGGSVADLLTTAPPVLAPAIDGLKAGKWLSVDLPALFTKYPQLSRGMSGADPDTPSPQAMLQLRTTLLEALLSHSTHRTTTENGETVTHLSVKAKSFLTAVMDALDSAGPTGMTPLATEKAKLGSLSDGTVDVELAVTKDHFTRATMDLHSLAMLGTDAAAKKRTEGVRAVVDIDDQGRGVSAPPAGRIVPLDDMVAPFLSQLTAAQGIGPSALASGLAQS